MFSIKKYSKLKSLFGLTTSLFLSFSLISCDLFNLDLEDFFVKYTETAAIDKDFKTDSIGIDISGIECVESNEDKTVTFYLRNPQHYKLVFSYEFDHKEIAGKFSSQDVCSFLQSDNGNTYQSGRINAILQCNKVYSNMLFSNLPEYTNHKFFFPQRSKKLNNQRLIFIFTHTQRIINFWINRISIFFMILTTLFLLIFLSSWIIVFPETIPCK